VHNVDINKTEVHAVAAYGDYFSLLVQTTRQHHALTSCFRLLAISGLCYSSQ
jgi:hypothetical protein